jgi:hypothetical protein
LRSARLQGLLEVGPARLLAAMLEDLGVSTLCSIKTMTIFLSFWSIKPAMLPASMLGDYSTSVSSTPSCFPRLIDLLGNPFHITSLLDLLFSSFWTIIQAILPVTMLRYYSMMASLMPFEFFHRRFDLLEACFLYVVTRPLFIRQDHKQVGCQVNLFSFLFLDPRACYSTCR